MRWIWWVALGALGCDDGGSGGSGGAGGAGGGGDCPEVASSFSLELADPPQGEVPAGSEQVFRMRLVSVCGDPINDAPAIEVEAGSARVTADAEGWYRVVWTLAPLPIRQRVHLRYGPINETLTVDATATDPLPQTEQMGDIAAFLTAEGIDGTTEDLALTAERITLAVPGGLVHVDVDGQPTWQGVEALLNPLGIANAPDGGWWIVDIDASTLWRVTDDGVATAHLTAEAPGMLQRPNHLAVGPDGKIYFSDPCVGSVLRYDPESGAVDARVDFDPATEGGPNGVAFDAAGQLYMMTGNAIVQCQQIGLADIDAPLARLWRIPVDDAGFGTPEALTEPVGVFGDGLTFDALGNLYFIADTIEGLSLTESAIFVLPAEGGPPRRVVVAPEGILYANLAFGLGDFGPRTLYISLLSVPPATGDESRGLHRFDAQVMRAAAGN